MPPAITISTVDLDRIDLLLDRLPAAQSAARCRAWRKATASTGRTRTAARSAWKSWK
jgi:hypothetical protein